MLKQVDNFSVASLGIKRVLSAFEEKDRSTFAEALASLK